VIAAEFLGLDQKASLPSEEKALLDKHARFRRNDKRSPAYAINYLQPIIL
jgi:hypothetical protein